MELVFHSLDLDLDLVHLDLEFVHLVAENLDLVVGFSDPAAVDLVADHLVAALDLAVFLSRHCHGWWCC